ncbi:MULTISPECIES: winged helix-turn-helix transcriptional regulator [Natrinema]|uniref:Transcriptional regulator n=2 Tax=Natrinema TaxID=88723 RepID=A0A2A5QTT9_9EURY|nr:MULTISPECIES: helix-turn-helix domain-containing protein [Natrinema]MBZ6496608.1 helix-turn-helix transcriptional regulator [Natrinema longum]PCR90268.1 transcriptional regulator [Natrinema ejinorense]QSW85493.1 helix-turn-helix transcriptional regulator [Natrinema longum]
MGESTQQLEVWCAGEDWCSITSTATLIGKKWHTVVVHRLLDNGPLGFNALQEEIGGISSKVLSDVLDDLEEKQLVDREIVNEKPVRVEYSLTELGESLEPVIDAMQTWGKQHLAAASDKDSSIA